MKRILHTLLLFIIPFAGFSQRITYSERVREESRNMNFDIIGKVSGNILVFKNVRWKYAISVYDDEMLLKEKVGLDFMPDKTFNADFIAYPDYIYLIYQYQKKGVVYCMAAKLDGDAKPMSDPVILDTTQVGATGDNRIYSVVNSDDKQHIIVFKIHKKYDNVNFVTLHYNNQLTMLHRTRHVIDYSERRESLSDFFVDNSGNFLFCKSTRSGNQDNLSSLSILTKAALADTFHESRIGLEGNYIDEVKIKVDNVNRRYVINSFYYKERRGNIAGFYNAIWDPVADSAASSRFIPLDDSIRVLAKKQGNLRSSLDDFFIRNIILKKNGGFWVIAEEYSSQTTGGGQWNRWDYLDFSPYYNPYFYTPYYGGFYRPFNSFNNQQTVRYYYDNILVLSMDKSGEMEWSTVIPKSQDDDDNDNHLSFSSFVFNGEVHFLYNVQSKRDWLLSDNSISSSGTTKRNPTVKSSESGFDFLPRFAKQVGSKTFIIPCVFRNYICFAKVEF